MDNAKKILSYSINMLLKREARAACTSHTWDVQRTTAHALCKEALGLIPRSNTCTASFEYPSLQPVYHQACTQTEIKTNKKGARERTGTCIAYRQPRC